MKYFKLIINKKILFIIIIVFISLANTKPSNAEGPYFTKDERDYIDSIRVLKVVSINGIAPLSFIDSNGEVRGIGIRVVEQISEISGLKFDYQLYSTVEEALNSDFDIFTNATSAYSPKTITLSKPFLEAETILYLNSFVDPKTLDKRKFALVKGGRLPEGIKKENVVYFNDREAAITGVDKGIADYGYGNEYSLAFYTRQNRYKNLTTIPTGLEKREYCLGLREGNSILMSIVNKSISFIEKKQVHDFIIEEASKAERRKSFFNFIPDYEVGIFCASFITVAISALVSYLSIRDRRRLGLENELLTVKVQLDGLTGIYNPATVKELIKKSIEKKAANQIDTLVLIDVDNFKCINDGYGHLQGDSTLIHISKSLKDNFRQTDIIGRIGGDEFCVYMQDVPSEDFVIRKCSKLLDIIKDSNDAFEITVSIGISYLSKKLTYEELFNQADTALYSAKNSGGSQVVSYKIVENNL